MKPSAGSEASPYSLGKLKSPVKVAEPVAGPMPNSRSRLPPNPSEVVPYTRLAPAS